MNGSSSLTITSAQNGSVLEFRGELPRGLSGYNGAYFGVSLRVDGLSARARVYDIHLDHWSLFFRDLADNWRGWSGARSHESLEHHLRIEATADSVGHIRLLVMLRDDPNHTWKAEGSVFLEAGQLEELAGRAMAYFG